MRKRTKLLAILLLGAAVGASVLAMSACSGSCNGNPSNPGADTDITDPDVPLGPGECKHEAVKHVPATKPGCETSGNIEYWFCNDCGKYYSNSALTVETSLASVVIRAVGHNYGTLIDGESADCEHGGVMAHYHCSVCQKDFDAQKNPVTDLVIPAAPHAYGDLIKEEPATCEHTGVIAHYHCSSCQKDFDADKKPVTDLVIPVAPHTYGDWIEEQSASCTQDGVKAHYHCSACGKDYDKQNNVIEDLVIDGGHEYGLLIPETPAGVCTDGVKAHYHCGVCGTDFDENKVEFNGLPEPIGNGFITIPAPHDLVLINAKPATCEEDGVMEDYRHCNACGKNFDPVVMMELEEAPTTEKLGHDYPDDFTYDYTDNCYKKICRNDENHVFTLGAGTAGYPYLAKDETTLKAVLTKGGYIELVDDIVLSKSIAIMQDVNLNINLNGKSISNTKTVAHIFQLQKDVNIGLTLTNGTLNNVYDGTSSSYAIRVISSTSADKVSKLSLTDVTINNYSKTLLENKYSGYTTKCSSVYLGAYAQVELLRCNFNQGLYGINYKQDSVVKMTGCKIDGTLSCLQGNGSEHNTTVTLNNTDVNSYYGIYHPQDGKIVINGGVIATVGTALEIRGGVAEIKGAQLSSTYEFGATANNNGNTTSGCAIAVSQHDTDKPINVTIEGCTLTAVYAVYEKDFQNTTARDVITITLGEGNTYNGCVYSENCANLAEFGANSHSFESGVCTVCGCAQGSQEAPYLISSEAEWVAFAKAHDEKTVTTEKEDVHYLVTSNLDFTNVTERVDVFHFTGTIDFGGHSVKGLTTKNVNYAYGATRGLFVLTHDATIKNLDYELAYFGSANALAFPVLFVWRGDVVLDNVTVSGNATHASNNAAAFVYFAWANAYNSSYVNPDAGKKGYVKIPDAAINLTFKNCTNYSNITNTGAGTSGYAAAFLGQVVGNSEGNTVKFINCVNEGTITGYHYAAMLMANQCSAPNINTLVVENCVNNGKIYSGIANGASLVIGDTSSGSRKEYNAANSGEGKLVNGEKGVTSNISITTLAIGEDGNYVINAVDGATTYKMEFVFSVRDDVNLDKDGKPIHWGTTNITIDVNADSKVKALAFVDFQDVEGYEKNEFGLYVTADGKNYVITQSNPELQDLRMLAQPTVYLTAYNAEGEVVGVSTCYLGDVLNTVA